MPSGGYDLPNAQPTAIRSLVELSSTSYANTVANLPLSRRSLIVLARGVRNVQATAGVHTVILPAA